MEIDSRTNIIHLHLLNCVTFLNVFVTAPASNDGNLLLCVKSIIDGDYEQVLLGEVAMAILGSGEDDIGDASDVVDFIQKKVEAFIQKSQTKDDNSR